MKKMIIFFWMLGTYLQAQVAINNSGSAPDASAMLDVSSTDRGILIPRMTASERDNISSPATGLFVYVTDDNSFYYYDGSSWLQMTTSDKAWLLNGNTGTDASTNFIGTTDAQDLVFKTNGNTHMIIDQNGFVGINTTPSSNYSLAVSGSSSVNGVLGIASGNNVFGGVFANTDTDGTGIVAAGNNAGIVYLTNGSGIGGVGTKVGVYGYGNDSNEGTGIIGIGNGLTTYYVSGSGEGAAFTGNLYGLNSYALASDDNAVAVYGSYSSGSSNDGTGVVGYSIPADYYGYGVKGYGGWIGVYGYAYNGLAGVYAYSDNSSYAFYGVGDLYVTGDLSAGGSKPFAIDYPMDPTNKILKHFSIESNEILNVYRGNVVLNANGEAEVQLPEYFLAINRNFSYNLTPIGETAPNLHIKSEINSEGKFVISGGNPGQKVSWYVYAERNDPYLQKYPEKRQVIVEKDSKLKGKYLNPELYGQPKEKGVFRESMLLTPKKSVSKKIKKVSDKK